VRYDVLSIDIGSTPNASAPGAAEHAIAVKPIDRFLERWDALGERIVRSRGATTLAVVGGGAGGVELLLSAQHRLRTLLQAAGRSDAELECHLFTSSPRILPTYNARARQSFGRILESRRVRVHTSSEVAEVGPGWLRTASGTRHQVDEVLWTTEARAAEWLRASGLATDEGGFVRVGPTLQSVSHPEVFAAGDVASIVNARLQKSGVYAVRQGEVLGPNLRRALAGLPLKPYRPQRRFLSIISTGDKFAVASRGAVAFQGRWVWRWKDSIDRRFMRQYSELPVVEAPEAAQPVRRVSK
jgi:selenide,water dikinase